MLVKKLLPVNVTRLAYQSASQQYFSLTTNQHQHKPASQLAVIFSRNKSASAPATSQPNVDV
jgi:hypothetical protein